MRHYSVKHAWIKSREGRFVAPIALLAIVLLIALFPVPGFLLYHLARHEASSSVSIQALSASFLYLVLIGIIVSVPPGPGAAVTMFIISIIMAIVLWVVALLLIDPHFNMSWHSITNPAAPSTAKMVGYVAFFGATGMFTFILCFTALLYAASVTRSYSWRKYPNYVLLNSLIHVLAMLTERRVLIYEGYRKLTRVGFRGSQSNCH